MHSLLSATQLVEASAMKVTLPLESNSYPRFPELSRHRFMVPNEASAEPIGLYRTAKIAPSSWFCQNLVFS
jgi:hypothetical protein